jgi:hypothetical protein
LELQLAKSTVGTNYAEQGNIQANFWAVGRVGGLNTASRTTGVGALDIIILPLSLYSVLLHILYIL